ncbi:MAG: 50S ribosomal protein L9 [Candidatus Aminicenantes bacterium]|nr:MAG: 50S ribosomal protein L9 [Candidatus Aminicenantes bacterium]
MKIMLKQDLEGLGKRGDIIEVAPGYGRNYLIPKKMALEVTSSNMRMIEIEKQALMKDLEKERLTFQGLTQSLNQTTLTFKRKAGEKDVIFGSVSSTDIKDALADAGLEVDKKKILLDEPIKRLGNFTVPIKVFHEDRAEIKIEIMKEGEEEAKEEKEKKEASEVEKEDIEAKKEEPEKEEKEKEEEKKVEELEKEEKKTEKAEKVEEEKEGEERQEEKKGEVDIAADEKLDEAAEEKEEPAKEEKEEEDTKEEKE